MQSEDHRRTALPYPLVHWTLCRCQQYGAFSMKALGYQIILLGEQRHIRCEQLAQGCCPNNAAVGKPTTSWSWVQRPTTTPPRLLRYTKERSESGINLSTIAVPSEARNSTFRLPGQCYNIYVVVWLCAVTALAGLLLLFFRQMTTMLLLHHTTVSLPWSSWQNVLTVCFL